MPNIDTLSIQFNANGTEKAINNIKAMGYAVRSLAQSVKSIDAGKLSAFTSSMETIKKSVPTEAQTNRMVAFGEAVKSLSSVIGSSNLGGFSKDMSNLGEAVNTFKKSSVNSITNAVTAMQNLQTQTQATANVISNAVPKKSANVERGDNRAKMPSVDTTVAELDKIGSRVDAIKSKFKGIFVPTKQFKTLEEQANKVAKKYDELRTKMQEALKNGSMTVDDSSFKKQSAELDALRQQYNDLIQKQKELALSGGGIVLNPTLKSSLDAFHKGFSSVTNIIKNGFVAGIRHANSAIKSFASHVKQSATSLKNTVTGGHKATDMAKKLANEIFRVSKMLKLMVTRMALRAVIKEVGNGFKSLALHSEEFNNSMSSLINGSKKLGYSFAAMVSPLINALAPAIVYVINLLTKLINVIQQVFGALTGATTWNKAKDFTESWADNIKEANKGAKELKKTVLGFDELNQLQEKTSGGGGNDITDMFETMDIDPKWKDFADWLKDMWKMGDFTKLGEKLGKGLRSLLESIPWEKIRKTSHKLGESLATLINGFVEVERLGYDIGKTIAQSVNTVFEFINGFVHRLHWNSIGKFIADTFNGFFENIDWVLIKDTVVTGLAGIAEAIQNFIDEFHWDNISDFVINGVDTITSGILAFVDGINWLDLGKKIGEQIRKSIEGIDWYDVGQAIGAIIQAAVDWVSGMLETMPSVETLIQKATDLMHGLFDRVDSEEIGANIGKIMQGIYDFLVGFWDENGEEIKNEVKKFFKGIWDNIDKADLIKVLANILLVASLGGIASVAWTVIKQKFAEKFLGVLTAKTLQTAVANGMASTITAGTEAAVETAAGSATVTAAAEAAGLSTGVIWGGGVVLGIGKALADADMSKNIGFNIAEKVLPDSKGKIDELREAYSGLGGSISFFKDILGLSFDAITNDTEAIKNSTTDFMRIMTDSTTSAQSYSDQIKNISEETTKSTAALKESNTAYDNLKKTTEAGTKETSKWVEEHRKSLEQFNKIKESASQAADSTNKSKESLATLTDTSKKATTELGNLSKSMTESLTKSTNDLSESIKKLETDTKTSFTAISESSKLVVEKIPADVTKAVETITKSENDLATSTDTSMKSIQTTVDETTKSFEESFKKIKDGMTKENWTFNGVAEGLTETFRKAKEGIKGEWNQIANKLNGEHEIGSEKVKINLPKFATGGFPEDGLFMANHHELVGHFSNGKTAVANNGQIIAGIETGVYSAMSKAMSQNNGGSQYISNEIIVDGDVIARTVSKAQDRQNRRFSPATT